MGELTRREQCDKAFDALISTFVVVVLRALNDVEQPVAIVGDSLERGVDAVLLPRVFQLQHGEEQIQVRPQFVRVGKGNL